MLSLLEIIPIQYLMDYELRELREMLLKQGRVHEDLYYHLMQEIYRRGLA